MERISFATLIKHTGDVYKNEKSIETDAIEGLNPEIYANFREKISLSFRESSFGSFARSKKALSWLYSTLCDLNIRVARDRRIASRIYIIFSTADKFIIRGLIFFIFGFSFGPLTSLVRPSTRTPCNWCWSRSTSLEGSPRSTILSWCCVLRRKVCVYC